MKTRYIIYGLAVASLTLASCSDFETTPEGSNITTDQKSDIVNNLPERSQAGVRAIFQTMNNYEANYEAFGKVERHNDIGYPSVLMFTDANTEDVSADNNGYNWNGNSLDYSDRQYTTYESQMVWNDHYQVIFAANNVVKEYTSSDEDPTNDESRFYYAQGLAARAYMYFNLAQLYQFTYKGNEDKLCVPIITEKNADNASVDGEECATVAKVYEQIKSDIDHAITLLTDNSYKRSDKRYISLEVAYGIRARVNLVMQNWTEAASDAESAITAAAASKIVPATMSDLELPTFVSQNESDWMWGIVVAETDRAVTSGIVNWISHCGTFNYGYGQYSKGRQINKKLYDQVASTDVRKRWWSNAKKKNDYLPEEYNTYLKQRGFPAYTNCKFGTYDGTIGCSTNANDIVLMRIEEMYLIDAEATAMAGDEIKGKQILEDFIKTYRDPKYTCTGSVQDAVYLQKRIEFWGEGLIWFDVMRLNKGIDRRGGGFVAAAVFNIPAKSPILLWRIPQTEINANSKLTDAVNNDRTVAAPDPVADK